MKLDEKRLLDEGFTSNEPVLGAAFCSYTFDPAYFEEHVLRSVLRLNGDPEEDPARFHEEARAALREIPVACLVDASARSPGRRLPYDLHLVRSRTFHPKVMLVLYESEARLAIGSGNLTKGGLEQNTELFFFRALPYADPVASALLVETCAFFESCAGLAPRDGRQLGDVLLQARRRAATTPLAANAKVDVQLVTPFQGRLLARVEAALPTSARIVRVGLLAPFYERDDEDAGREDGFGAVLGEILAMRPSTEARVDIAVPWDDAAVAAPLAVSPPQFEQGLGRLWAWRIKDETDDGPRFRLEYFVIDKLTPQRVRGRDARGASLQKDRAPLEEALAAGQLWPVPAPSVFAPQHLLRRVSTEFPVALWLHPSSELTPEGKLRRRPLHAKAVLVTFVDRGSSTTLALLGSANASRAALTRSVESGGNVEACVLLRFEGELSVAELLPSLVQHDLETVTLKERPQLEPPPDLSVWIEAITFDAEREELFVQWASDGPHVPDWSLSYAGLQLAQGHGPHSGLMTVTPFTLEPSSAEVLFSSSGAEWSIPITVLDVTKLPASSLLAGLTLREMLALLGRRLAAERLSTLRAQRSATGIASVLDVLFGEGFGPTDVFKAWWGLAEDLAHAGSLAAFRARLVGAGGARAVWRALASTSELSSDEKWVYGCELRKELSALELPTTGDGPERRAQLQSFLDELSTELVGIAGEIDQPWMASVREFYGLGSGGAP